MPLRTVHSEDVCETNVKERGQSDSKPSRASRRRLGYCTHCSQSAAFQKEAVSSQNPAQFSKPCTEVRRASPSTHFDSVFHARPRKMTALSRPSSLCLGSYHGIVNSLRRRRPNICEIQGKNIKKPCQNLRHVHTPPSNRKENSGDRGQRHKLFQKQQ